MLYVYEFEVFENDGMLLALPFDFEGGTQGVDKKEVAEMAADWLKTEIEHRLMDGESVPEATFGHEPQEGGQVLIVAIEADLDTVDAMPAHQAAEALGVSRGRISQMVSSGLLEGFRKGRDAFVTVASVEARLENPVQAGRPRMGNRHGARAGGRKGHRHGSVV